MENKISRSLLPRNFFGKFWNSLTFPWLFSFFPNFTDWKWNSLTFPWPGIFFIFQTFFPDRGNPVYFGFWIVSLCLKSSCRSYIGLDATKPVFGVCEKVRLKLVCSPTGTSYIEILHILFDLIPYAPSTIFRMCRLVCAFVVHKPRRPVGFSCVKAKILCRAQW